MATSPQYTARGYKTTYRLLTSDAQAGRIVGTYAVKTLRFKRIAIIDDRTAYGQASPTNSRRPSKRRAARSSSATSRTTRRSISPRS